MTIVSGKRLEWCLQTGDNITPEVLESAPRAIAAAMKEYWSFGHPYGELNLRNIMCDIKARTISFVDPGVRDNSHFCNDVATRWCPAARDIAYLLFDAGVTVAIGNYSARKRQQMFTDLALQALVETVDSLEGKKRLLDEIEACAQARLNMLDASWSPRGLWHVLVKRIAARRIDAMLLRMNAQSAEGRS